MSSSSSSSSSIAAAQVLTDDMWKEMMVLQMKAGEESTQNKGDASYRAIRQAALGGGNAKCRESTLLLIVGHSRRRRRHQHAITMTLPKRLCLQNATLRTTARPDRPVHEDKPEWTGRTALPDKPDSQDRRENRPFLHRLVVRPTARSAQTGQSVLLGRRGQPDPKVPKVPRVKWGHPARRESPVRTGRPEIQGRTDHRDPMGLPVRLVPPA